MLSPKEILILSRYASGMSNTEIADHLCLSAYTVRNHTTSIRKKLGAKTIAHAVYLFYGKENRCSKCGAPRTQYTCHYCGWVEPTVRTVDGTQ